MPFPIGLILIWSGAIVDIPAGYVLCDGNNGTPDLRNNFVVGAGDTYAVDDTGGNINHNHDFIGDGHNHSLVFGAELASGSGRVTTTSSNSAVGTTDNGSSLPPFYALAYIMKT